ncbi:MAG TPA: hypothetical protein VGI17_08995 [Solirubrobacterales bacterium]|jgi:hypothetical protein
MTGGADVGRYLPIYLNDHYAGAVAGVELARRLLAANREVEALAPTLQRVSAEIEADRGTLEGVLDRLDVSRSPVKPAAAWLLERVGRLKPNGHLRGYSPLSRILELEGLAIGISGKAELWRTLSGLGLDERAGVDFDALTRRAEEQHAAISDLHRIAVATIDGPRD